MTLECESVQMLDCEWSAWGAPFIQHGSGTGLQNIQRSARMVPQTDLHFHVNDTIHSGVHLHVPFIDGGYCQQVWNKHAPQAGTPAVVAGYFYQVKLEKQLRWQNEKMVVTSFANLQASFNRSNPMAWLIFWPATRRPWEADQWTNSW